MVPRTPIAVKPPSPTGASLRLTSLVTGIRSRAAFLHQAPPAVLIPNEPESERPGPEDSQPRLAAEYPRPGNPQATGHRRKPKCCPVAEGCHLCCTAVHSRGKRTRAGGAVGDGAWRPPTECGG